MPTIILDRTITESTWQVIEKGSMALERADIIVPLATWLEHQTLLSARKDVGVWLDADEEAEALAESVATLPVIGVNFPTFFDGRSLSNATILRRTLGYEGQIRAIGDVRRDQLDQMARCGINAFQLAEGQDPQQALEAFDPFSYNYQSSVGSAGPLFRARSMA